MVVIDLLLHTNKRNNRNRISRFRIFPFLKFLLNFVNAICLYLCSRCFGQLCFLGIECPVKYSFRSRFVVMHNIDHF